MGAGVKDGLKRWYRETAIGHTLIQPVKVAYETVAWRSLPERAYLELAFRRKLGYRLDLETPRTFNEKIQWLKLNDRRPLHTRCADKFAVRSLTASTLGEQYLVPLVLHTDDPGEITPGNLPDYPVIIKTTHGSGEVIIVRSKEAVDWKAARRNLRSQLRNNYYHRSKEWQYRDIQPSIVVERLLLDGRGQIPSDYKFHCLNGAVRFVQVDFDRHGSHTRNLYDPEWRLLDCRYLYPNGPDVEPPKQLELMIALAEKMAGLFPYVRVDLYNLGADVWFGELTFHPEGGLAPFVPRSWDVDFGAMLTLDTGEGSSR